jgi:hypothetical protein
VSNPAKARPRNNNMNNNDTGIIIEIKITTAVLQ